MIWKRWGNEKGVSAILAAFFICVVIVIAFGAVTTMLSYRQKDYVRMKEAFKLLNVMEQASKAVREKWDEAAAAALPLNTPAAIAAKMTALTPDPSCVADCQAVYGGATPALCYANSDGGHAYCIYGNAQILTGAKLELKIMDPNDPPKSNLIGRLKVILDSYVLALLDKMPATQYLRGFSKEPALAMMFQESTAHAISYRTDNVGILPPVCAPGVAPPACPAANCGCMACGPGTGAVCGMIYACPLSFVGCAAYTGGSNAAFAQEFYIVPPGNTK